MTAHTHTRLHSPNNVRSARPRLALLAVAMSLLSAGCGDTSETESSQDSVWAPATSPRSIQWIEINSPVAPERWLASRDEPEFRDADDPEVRRIGVLLDNAHRLYRESSRMIANRAVQVEEALATRGLPDKATDVLADLSSLAGEVGQTEGFGAMCQHYINMRSSGLERADVVGTLKDRYGKRK